MTCPLISRRGACPLMTRAFCVKEKKSRDIVAPKTVTFKNGRHALKGKCASCGTTLFRITGK